MFSCFDEDCEEGLAFYSVRPNGSIVGSCSTHMRYLGIYIKSPVNRIVAKVNTHADPSPCPLTACLRRLLCGVLQERVVATMWVGRMLFKLTQPQLDTLLVSIGEWPRVV